MNLGAIFLSAVLALVMSILGTCGVLLVRAIWPEYPTETFAILFTGVLAAVVGSIAVVAAIWGTISARKIARSQTTLEHISNLEVDGTFQQNKAKYAALIREGVNIAIYAQADKEGDPDTTAIVSVLNEYELVSIGIQRGIIDPELYKRWARSSVLFDWESTQQFVAALRKRTGASSLYHEFEEMARWMGQNRLPHRRFWWAGA